MSSIQREAVNVIAMGNNGCSITRRHAMQLVGHDTDSRCRTARMNDPHKDKLVGQPAPTIEQVAWVFAHVRDALTEGSTFRGLIYDRMGFPPSAYTPLYLAGGMFITDIGEEL